MRKAIYIDKVKPEGEYPCDQNMLDIARQIIKKDKWRGGMELELIKTIDSNIIL